MAIKETYEEQIESRLDELNLEIKELAAQADQAKGEAKNKYQAELNDLEKQRDETQAQLDEIKESGDKATDDIKSGLDKAVDNLGDAVSSAKERFDFSGNGS